MKRARLSFQCLVIALSIASPVDSRAAANASAPATASPGDPAAFAPVSGPCPTFSWGAAREADHYELLLYAFDSEGVAEDRPRLRQRLPGSLTTWTPPLEHCPAPGRYAWMVRVTDGGGVTEWSQPRFFLLADTPSAQALEVFVESAVRQEAASESPGPAEPPVTGPPGEPLLDRGSSVGVRTDGSSSREAWRPTASSPPEARAVIDQEPDPGPAGLVSAAATTAPSFVLADGGVRFPDGSLQTRAPWNENGLNSLRVTGSALKPRENDVSYDVSTDGGCTYVSAGNNFTVWNTPVHLPQGARVDTLRMYFYDTSASNTGGWLTVYDLYGSIVDEWSVSSSGNSGHSFNDSAAIDHVVDHSVYSYLLNWRPSVTGSSIQLCGFRIFFGS